MQSTVQSEHTHTKEKEGIEVKQFLKPMLGFIMIVGQPLLVIIIYIFPKKKKSAASTYVQVCAQKFFRFPITWSIRTIQVQIEFGNYFKVQKSFK